MTYGQRTYERETILWNWEDLHRLEAEGKATRKTDLGLWIVKRDEGGTVVVRDAQVLVGDGMTAEEAAEQQAAEIYAENAWLRHAENAGWEETELERQIEAERGVIPFDVALRNAERSVREDIDGDDAYTQELIASEDDAREQARKRIRDEEAALLAKFGVT